MLQIVTAEIRTANVADFQRKPQFSLFSACPEGSPSQLIRTSRVILYLNFHEPLLKILFGETFLFVSLCKCSRFT